MESKNWTFFYAHIQPCEFPYGTGDDVYDIIAKKKAKIVRTETETQGIYVNSLAVIVSYYHKPEKTYRISMNVFFRRFINITQLIHIKKEDGNGRNWTENFV